MHVHGVLAEYMHEKLQASSLTFRQLTEPNRNKRKCLFNFRKLKLTMYFMYSQLN